MLRPNGQDETLDILCNEKLKVIQKKDGYRFSIDAILIANFIILKKGERLLDIGTGCGIIPIYMSIQGCRNHMTGIEIQKDLYGLAVRNGDLNGCDNVHFIPGDVKSFKRRHGDSPFHVIVSNPPYTKANTGRKSPNDSRCIARYESMLDLSDLLSSCASLLYKKGRFCCIYPSKRIGELTYTAKSKGFELKRLRPVYPKNHLKSDLVLAEFMKDGGIGAVIEKPLYIYDNGRYTDEVQNYYTWNAA